MSGKHESKPAGCPVRGSQSLNRLSAACDERERARRLSREERAQATLDLEASLAAELEAVGARLREEQTADPEPRKPLVEVTHAMREAWERRKRDREAAAESQRRAIRERHSKALHEVRAAALRADP